MAYTRKGKKTISDNHLSEIARKGQGSDTELAHVNPYEKTLLKALGGSGDINPETGLRQFTVPDPIEMAQLAFSMYQYGSGIKQEREEAAMQIKNIDEQVQSLDTAQDQVSNLTETKKKSLYAQVGHSISGIGAQSGASYAGLTGQLSNITRKTGGIESSGQLDQMRTTGMQNIFKDYGMKTEGAYGQLGAGLGEIQAWSAGKVSAIKGQKQALKYQKELLGMKKDQKIFGVL